MSTQYLTISVAFAEMQHETQLKCLQNATMQFFFVLVAIAAHAASATGGSDQGVERDDDATAQSGKYFGPRGDTLTRVALSSFGARGSHATADLGKDTRMPMHVHVCPAHLCMACLLHTSAVACAPSHEMRKHVHADVDACLHARINMQMRAHRIMQ